MAGSTHEKIKARRQKIRRLHSEGRSVNEIATELSVGIQTVYTDHRAMDLSPNAPDRDRGKNRARLDSLRRKCVQCGSRKGLTTFKGLRLCETCLLKHDVDELYEERQRFEMLRGFRSSCLAGAT